MDRWLIFLGSALVASFIGYALYNNLERLADDPSAATIFPVLGMIGLLFILGAVALQRTRS